jgi:hypothetical protein
MTVAMIASALPFGVAACGGGGDGSTAPGGSRSEPSTGTSGLAHVHGVGVNPADGSLIIATHFGLYRATPGSLKATPYGTSRQDVMGFTVLGPNRFLGSGHPAAEQNLPNPIGLIESRDGGGSWRGISLAGEADFHVLRARGSRVYGFNSMTGALMVSRDRGRTWQETRPPGGLLDLAIDPADPDRIVASTLEALFSSSNAGRTWRPLTPGAVGFLAWASAQRLYWIDAQGAVHVTRDGGRHWKATGGSIGGQPAAFASGGRDLYAVLGDGTAKRSTDGGKSWTVRATP